VATTHKNPSTVQLLREFSVPLVVGILLALAWANLSPASYHAVFHFRLLGHPALDFLTNDVFMVIFFGIAAVEITMSVAPGGSLNPPSKAVNPLLASAGGIAAPIVVYFVLNRMLGGPALRNGWGIPTATDIALAWLVARLAFGNGHPAISFLLLLAVADDAVGLVIVAVFYPDAALPLRPAFGLLVAAGMGIAYVMRRNKVNDYRPYLLLGGTASWAGLFLAHLHPALALVFIVPFLPHRTYGADESIFDARNSDQSALGRFEHQWKAIPFAFDRQDRRHLPARLARTGPRFPVAARRAKEGTPGPGDGCRHRPHCLAVYCRRGFRRFTG
jgi:NhaA family Na+:H+ antiporter